MQKKLIIFVLAVCVGMQFSVSSNREIQKDLNEQSLGYWDRIKRLFKNIGSSANAQVVRKRLYLALVVLQKTLSVRFLVVHPS